MSRRVFTFRTFIFWLHLPAGILAGLVILLMCVTGVLLTYERQLIAWSDSHFRSAPPGPGVERLPVESLLARLRAARTSQRQPSPSDSKLTRRWRMPSPNE